jgi:hypothetical protein
MNSQKRAILGTWKRSSIMSSIDARAVIDVVVANTVLTIDGAVSTEGSTG